MISYVPVLEHLQCNDESDKNRAPRWMHSIAIEFKETMLFLMQSSVMTNDHEVDAIKMGSHVDNVLVATSAIFVSKRPKKSLT